jgi:hypothetical protein
MMEFIDFVAVSERDYWPAFVSPEPLDTDYGYDLAERIVVVSCAHSSAEWPEILADAATWIRSVLCHDPSPASGR